MFKTTSGKPLFFIYLTIFINLIGFGMVFPLIPLYAKQFDASSALIGVIMSSFAVGQFVFSPVWGRLSDRFGRKPIISAALLGLSLSFLVFAMAPNLVIIFFSRFLQGVFSAAALPVAQAYVADVTTKEERIKGMGNLGASLSLGFIFGPAIGGFLSLIDHNFPFFASSALALVNLVSVYLFLPESLTQKSDRLNLRSGLFNFKGMYVGLKGELGILFVMLLLWSYSLSNNQVAVPLLGSEYFNTSALTISIYFSGVGFVSAFVQSVLVHRFVEKIGSHKTATVGLSLMATGLILMPFSPIDVIMAACMLIVAFGSGMARPTLNTLISQETKEGQGTTMGVATSFESFGRILGPLLGGVLFAYGFILPFTICALAVYSILFYVVKVKKFLKP